MVSISDISIESQTGWQSLGMCSRSRRFQVRTRRHYASASSLRQLIATRETHPDRPASMPPHGRRPSKNDSIDCRRTVRRTEGFDGTSSRFPAAHLDVLEPTSTLRRPTCPSCSQIGFSPFTSADWMRSGQAVPSATLRYRPWCLTQALPPFVHSPGRAHGKTHDSLHRLVRWCRSP
jgi:hypothetical protein